MIMLKNVRFSFLKKYIYTEPSMPFLWGKYSELVSKCIR